MDVIANRITPQHYDQGGAISFYNHLELALVRVMMPNFCLQTFMQSFHTNLEHLFYLQVRFWCTQFQSGLGGRG